MNPKFFGDSYDIVKKSLISWLKPGGEWAVHPMFTGDFKGETESAAKAQTFADFLKAKLVSPQVLTMQTNREEYFKPCRAFGNLFLDPDTGVCRGPKQSIKHIFAEELVEIVRARSKALTLVFDQSYSRGDDRANAIQKKLAIFAARQVHGFAYDSHATFLLLCDDSELLEQAYNGLLETSGLPGKRILRNQR